MPSLSQLWQLMEPLAVGSSDLELHIVQARLPSLLKPITRVRLKQLEAGQDEDPWFVAGLVGPLVGKMPSGTQRELCC